MFRDAGSHSVGRPARHWAQMPQEGTNEKATWSPSCRPRTSFPTASTTPAPSCPSTTGQRPSPSNPSARFTSEWQTPAAATRTSTSSARGGSSSTFSTATGWPRSRSTTASIVIVPFPVSTGALVRRACNRGLRYLEAPELLNRDVALDRVPRLGFGQRRLGRLADIAEVTRAARVEHATTRRVGGAGYLPLEVDPFLADVLEGGYRRQQRLCVGMLRAAEHGFGASNLHHAPEVQHGDPIGQIAHDSEVMADEQI